MSFEPYKIRWTEYWERTRTVKVDMDALRDWANIPHGPIPSEIVVEFLQSGEYSDWHPGTTPEMGNVADEFQSLDIEDAEVVAS
jgi:hypothetical protein